jgi:hypothetical protein
MDAVVVDGSLEMRKRVQQPLLRAPVEAVLPVRDEFAQVRQLRAVVPVRAFDLVGEARARQSFAEIGERRFGDLDLERLDGFAPGRFLRDLAVERKEAGTLRVPASRTKSLRDCQRPLVRRPTSM